VASVNRVKNLTIQILKIMKTKKISTSITMKRSSNYVLGAITAFFGTPNWMIKLAKVLLLIDAFFSTIRLCINVNNFNDFKAEMMDTFKWSCTIYLIQYEEAQKNYEYMINGYSIRFNRMWGYYQVSHTEIGSCIAEFNELNPAFEYCIKG
jgi:hypothetical protein